MAKQIPKIVHICWIDAELYGSLVSREQRHVLRESQWAQVESVGWLLGEIGEGQVQRTIVARSRFTKPEDPEYEADYRGIEEIPNVCIISLVELVPPSFPPSQGKGLGQEGPGG